MHKEVAGSYILTTAKVMLSVDLPVFNCFPSCLTSFCENDHFTPATHFVVFDSLSSVARGLILSTSFSAALQVLSSGTCKLAQHTDQQ